MMVDEEIITSECDALNSKVNIEIQKGDEKYKIISDCYSEKRRDLVIIAVLLIVIIGISIKLYELSNKSQNKSV